MSGRTKRHPAANRFDYIVVGAGAAGCVIAARLSEDPDVSVLLLEAGGSNRNPIYHVPGLGFLASSNTRSNWGFVTEKMPELNDRQQVWLQGKLLGGSSSINGMIYTRGHSREYDLWAQMGCRGWSFDDVLPFFRKSEANQRGADEWHGGDGPVKIRQSSPRLPIYRAFLDAAAARGFPTLDDLNRDTVDGFGFYDVNISGGRRQSAAATYLHATRHRKNLTTWTGAEARRLLIEDGSVEGVELARDGDIRQAWATREVIVSCGAIKSPQLLMLSGIGPAEHLAEMGISVLVDAPNVGANLQNHASYRLQYACSEPVTAFSDASAKGAATALLSYGVGRSGGLAESIFGVGGFFRTRSELEIPDIQVVMCAALLPRAPVGKQFWKMLPKEQGFALIVYQGTPYSRGTVRLASSDPAAPPRIAPGYLSDPRDLEVLVAGVQRVREICRDPILARVIQSEIQPGAGVTTDAELVADIRQNVATSYHQCGTCRMGSRPSDVLDPELRVRGVGKLRVADTSIMPFLPNAALHGPTLMIGEKAASMIMQRVAEPT